MTKANEGEGDPSSVGGLNLSGSNFVVSVSPVSEGLTLNTLNQDYFWIAFGTAE